MTTAGSAWGAADRCVRVVVRGRVQGVYYRASTAREARALGLRGWVRNLPDGSVEFLAQGPGERVDRLLAWAREGPPAARVADLLVRDEAQHLDLDDFSVRR